MVWNRERFANSVWSNAFELHVASTLRHNVEAKMTKSRDGLSA
jgi:hypothetical protein